MALSRRYTPQLAPYDTNLYSMNFEFLLGPGVGIVPYAVQQVIYPVAGQAPLPRLEIWGNTAGAGPVSTDFIVDSTLAPAGAPAWWWRSINTPTDPVQPYSGQWWSGSAYNPPGGTPSNQGIMAWGVLTRGRRVYCRLLGSDPRVDYQFRWTVMDTTGQVWTRTALQGIAYPS